MNDDTVLRGEFIFHGTEYNIELTISESALIIEVEDCETSEQWHGEFPVSYIEELTHKTGNFKQFSIFTNMLETALTQSSDSVSLDLLTYSDLQSLRNKKTAGNRNNTPAKSMSLNSKRYLILTYSVEFDRIHYPLPLPYFGKPDPKALQKTVRQLKNELQILQENGSCEQHLKEINLLKKECLKLCREKEDIERGFKEYRSDIKVVGKSHTVRDIKMMKNMIKNLEGELLRDKNKHQRVSSKKGSDYKRILLDLEEVKASERNLKCRVKSLTNELAAYKRPGALSPANSTRDRRSVSRERSASKERTNVRDRSASRERSLSREKYSPQFKGHSSEPPFSRFSGRGRSLSKERSLPPLSHTSKYHRQRSSSRDKNINSSGVSHRSSRTLTPSPVRPRFDPTSYVKDRQHRHREAELAKRRNIHGNLSGGSAQLRRSSPGYLSGRQPLSSRNRSPSPSVGSLSDVEMPSYSSDSRKRYKSSSVYWSSPEVPVRKSQSASKTKYTSSSTPDYGKKGHRVSSAKKENKPSDPLNRSVEIVEIEERLNRLQQYLQLHT